MIRMKKGLQEGLLIGVAAIWGFNYTIAKYAMAAIPSSAFNTARFLLSAPLLLLIAFMLEKSLAIRAQDRMRLAAVSIVGITLYQTLFMLSVKYATASCSYNRRGSVRSPGFRRYAAYSGA